MQDEAAVGPLGGAGVDDVLAVDGEVGHVGGADEGGDLSGRGGGLVGAAGLAGRGRNGDTAAPGVGRLPRAARVGVGQRVAGWDVHEEEGRERDGEAARLQILDGGDDGVVRRRAAVGRAAVDQADEVRLPRVRRRRRTRRAAAVTLSAELTPGRISHKAARRSVPNQPTMRLTEATLGERRLRAGRGRRTSRCRPGGCARSPRRWRRCRLCASRVPGHRRTRRRPG